MFNMPDWLNKTKEAVRALKQSGYFDNWALRKTELINFFIFPNLEVADEWFKKRINIYTENAKIFLGDSDPPKINFYVYPSIDSVKELGITPAISFLKEKEVHGHAEQSPGHELNHILLGILNPSENLPANGLWAEGLCVYFDGTKTNRKRHTLSLNYSEEIIKTPWAKWRSTLPQNLYPLAASIIQYCIETYGLKSTLKFVKNLRDSASNEEKLSCEIYKISFDNLQNDWRNWLK